MLQDKRYYMFFDFPKGETLRETGITLHKDKNGILNLDEDEVKAFLKKEFEQENLEVYSFWTIWPGKVFYMTMPRKIKKQSR